MKTETKDSSTAFFWCCTTLFALFAAYQTYLATAWGAGLTPDSISYIEGARTILKDGNLSGLGSHWPPLYFLLIAFWSVVLHDPLVAAKWLQITTMGINIFLIAYILYKNTGKSLVTSLVGTLLFVTSPTVLFIHAMAWTEALFCLFALLGFYFLAEYLQRQERISFFIASASFLGAAFVTRYAGVALIATAVISLFFWEQKRVLPRLAKSFVFGLISCIPMFVWMVRNILIDNGATDRNFIFHPVSMQEIHLGIGVLLDWLHLPASSSGALLGICFILLIACGYWATVFAAKEHSRNRLLEISFFFVLLYIAFIVFSISFFDAHTPLDQRILYPAYVFFFIGIVLMYHRIVQTFPQLWVRIALPAAVLFFCIQQFPAQQYFLTKAIENGLGYASKQWVQSDTLHWLRKMPLATVIYTNGPDPITIFTGRASTMLPNHTNPGTRRKNEKFDAEFKQMQEVLCNEHGVIVYFQSVNWRWYLPTLHDLSEKLPLGLVYQGKDGVVVTVRDCPAQGNVIPRGLR